MNFGLQTQPENALKHGPLALLKQRKGYNSRCILQETTAMKRISKDNYKQMMKEDFFSVKAVVFSCKVSKRTLFMDELWHHKGKFIHKLIVV